jgi:hypothetical protein
MFSVPEERQFGFLATFVAFGFGNYYDDLT